jgi:hypothetical protein
MSPSSRMGSTPPTAHESVLVEHSACRCHGPSNRSLCLVNDPHLLRIYSATVHRDVRESTLDLTKIRRRQLHVDCLQVLVLVIQVARARDGNNPRLLRQQPCQCDLGGRCVLLLGKALEELEDRPVRGQIVRREAVEPGPKIRVRVEPRANVTFPVR